jgi:hypothetical protein
MFSSDKNFGLCWIIKGEKKCFITLAFYLLFQASHFNVITFEKTRFNPIMLFTSVNRQLPR